MDELNNENKTTVAPKKEWNRPQLTILNANNTEGKMTFQVMESATWLGPAS